MRLLSTSTLGLIFILLNTQSLFATNYSELVNPKFAVGGQAGSYGYTLGKPAGVSGVSTTAGATLMLAPTARGTSLVPIRMVVNHNPGSSFDLSSTLPASTDTPTTTVNTAPFNSTGSLVKNVCPSLSGNATATATATIASDGSQWPVTVNSGINHKWAYATSSTGYTLSGLSYQTGSNATIALFANMPNTATLYWTGVAAAGTSGGTGAIFSKSASCWKFVYTPQMGTSICTVTDESTSGSCTGLTRALELGEELAANVLKVINPLQ